jgi:hypothetical protein
LFTRKTGQDQRGSPHRQRVLGDVEQQLPDAPAVEQVLDQGRGHERHRRGGRPEAEQDRETERRRSPDLLDLLAVTGRPDREELADHGEEAQQPVLDRRVTQPVRGHRGQDRDEHDQARDRHDRDEAFRGVTVDVGEPRRGRR